MSKALHDCFGDCFVWIVEGLFCLSVGIKWFTKISRQKDNAVWKHFIEALRGGIVDLGEGDNVRLSSIVTTFLARASIIMSSPDESLYFILHNFMYAKPHLKLNTVPAFLEMFYSTQANHR